MPPLSLKDYFPSSSSTSSYQFPSSSLNNKNIERNRTSIINQEQPLTPPSTPYSGLPSITTLSDELLLLKITRQKLELALTGSSSVSNSKTNLSQIEINPSSDNSDSSGGRSRAVVNNGRKLVGPASLRQLVLLQNCYCTLKEFWYYSNSNSRSSTTTNDSSDYFNQIYLEDPFIADVEQNGEEEIAEEEEWELERYDPERAWLEGILGEMQNETEEEEEEIQEIDLVQEGTLSISTTVPNLSNSEEKEELIEDSGFLEASKYNISGSNSNRYFSSSSSSSFNSSSSSFSSEKRSNPYYSNLDDSLYSLAEAEEEEDEEEEEEEIEIDVSHSSSHRPILDLAIPTSTPPAHQSTLSTSIDLSPISLSHQQNYISELEYLQQQQQEEADYESTFESSPPFFPPALTPDSSPPTFDESFISRRRRRSRRESIDEELELGLESFSSNSLSVVEGRRSGILDLSFSSIKFDGEKLRKDYNSISNLTTSLAQLSSNSNLIGILSINKSIQFNNSLSPTTIPFPFQHFSNSNSNLNSNSNHYSTTSTSTKYNMFHPLSISIESSCNSCKDGEDKTIVKTFY